VSKTIDNISIEEYLLMEDTSKYDVFLHHMNPENKLCGNRCNVNALTFDEVQVMRAIFNEPKSDDLMELYLMLFQIRGNRNENPLSILMRESVFQLFKATNFIRDYIEGINKKEKEWLSGDENQVLTMLNASKRLAPFNHLLKKIELAKMFGVTPDEIGRWKYLKVFNILAGMGVQNDIQKEFNEIK